MVRPGSVVDYDDTHERMKYARSFNRKNHDTPLPPVRDVPRTIAERRNVKGRPRGERYTQEDIIAAIEECGGLNYRAAALLECAQSTLYNYIHKYPAIQEAYIKAQNGITNMARENLAVAIADDGNIPVSQWWLGRRAPEFKPQADINIATDVIFHVVYDDEQVEQVVDHNDQIVEGLATRID
jgi:hypothetical protein